MKALEKLKVIGTCSVVGASVALASPPSYALDLFGPLTYLGFSDSPFNGPSFGYFHLEDFEDGLLNVPGVTPSSGVVTSTQFGGSIVDSVENEPNGDSFFSGNGLAGYTFTFSKATLGTLPTHAGLVWVDGVNNILFEAFDELGNSLGTRGGSHAGSGFFGGTQEDRFYGAINPTGISAIKITGGGGGIEIDHLQYGGALRQQPPSTSNVPGPLPVLGAAAAFGFSRSLRRRLKAVAPDNRIN